MRLCESVGAPSAMSRTMTQDERRSSRLLGTSMRANAHTHFTSVSVQGEARMDREDRVREGGSAMRLPGGGVVTRECVLAGGLWLAQTQDTRC